MTKKKYFLMIWRLRGIKEAILNNSFKMCPFWTLNFKNGSFWPKTLKFESLTKVSVYVSNQTMADRENLSRLWQLGLTGVSMESIRRGTTCLKNEHRFHLEWHESLDGGYNPRIQRFALCPHIETTYPRIFSCYKDLRRGLSGTGFPSLQLLGGFYCITPESWL